MTPLAIASQGLIDRGALPTLTIAIQGLLHGAVVPPSPAPSDGGSGNRRRNINDDPDAFAEFFAELKAKANPQQVGVPAPVIIGPDPFAELLAVQEALQAAMDAQEDRFALMALQRRIEDQERAYEAFLEEEDEEILLLM